MQPHVHLRRVIGKQCLGTQNVPGAGRAFAVRTPPSPRAGGANERRRANQIVVSDRGAVPLPRPRPKWIKMDMSCLPSLRQASRKTRALARLVKEDLKMPCEPDRK